MFYRRGLRNGVDKIDIRKSIISRTERVTNPSQNVSENCAPKLCPKIVSRNCVPKLCPKAAVRCCALLCAEKTSAPCKISTKHKQQSRFNFCERGKCAMHGRSMEGSRWLIHAAAEALRLPSKQHVQRWLHNREASEAFAALRCSALLCAAPHKPIKKTFAQCKISTQHKPPSRFSFCERGKCAMRCSQDCRAPPQQV